MSGTAKLKKITVSKSVKNNAPIAADVAVSENNGVLSGVYTYSDPDGDAEGATELKWYVESSDGTFDLIDGANTNTVQLTPEDDGKTYKFSVTPKDSKGLAGTEVMSAGYTYNYTAPIIYDEPTAEVFATTSKGAILTGNYEFGCDSKITGDDKDQSEYQWYISDKLFGDYEPIDGATDIVFTAKKKTSGKFLKFTVTPVDKKGNRGETQEAFPVMQNEGIYLDFENGFDILGDEGFKSNQPDNGAVAIEPDPVNSANNVLMIRRDTNNKIEGNERGITIADYRFSSPGSKTVISVDAYVSPEKITNELFYIFVSGLSQAYKIYTSGNRLVGAGGDGAGTQISETLMENFERGRWYNFRFEMDASSEINTVDCYVNGELKNQKKGWRTSGTGVSGIRSFLQAANFGYQCLDNIAIAGVDDYTGDVSKDAEALVIPEDLTEIMTDITLLTGGENGTTVSWQSSNPSVIADDGTVTRPAVGQPDAEVTLTAYIMKGTSVETKTFAARVMRLLNDEESVKKDAQKLDLYKNMILDGNITLPKSGANFTEIEWKSSVPEILSDDGRVDGGKNDTVVKMTVTVTRGSAKVEVEIPFYVLRKSPKNLIKDAKISVSSQVNGYAITKVNDEDMKTCWKASAADVEPVFEIDLGKVFDFTDLLLVNGEKPINNIRVSLSDDGSKWTDVGAFNADAESRVNRFEFTNGRARYMQIIADGEGQPEIYELRLYNNPSDSARVDSDYNELELNLAETSQSRFNLPLTLENGSAVKWTSSDTDVISIDSTGGAVVTKGKITRTVTLAAEISCGDVCRTKIFRITVKGTDSGGSGGGGSHGSGGINIPWGGTSGVSDSDSAVNDANDTNYISEFDDIDHVTWANDAINQLKKKGIINGISDREFAPDLYVTREEFAAMTVRAFGLPIVSERGNLFVDVLDGAWYNSAVTAAYAAGIIKGKADGSFGVGEEITREDMAVMLYRASALKGTSNTVFKDKNAISDYASEAVESLSSAGVINGDGDGFFNPLYAATRAEAAVMIYRIINR